MYFCLRVDLDYVPWDTPDAADFGHGEPAVLLRLLDLARFTGYKFHFFASNRVLRAFPSAIDAVLNDGHDLDWLCKHPGIGDARAPEALELFASMGHSPQGFAVRGTYPAEQKDLPPMPGLQFLSAAPGPHPPEVRLFPVETKTAREAVRGGLNTRSWTDAIKHTLRDGASRNLGNTLAIRPQVLAKYDPRLSHVREIVDLANAVGLPVRTLRDLVAQVG